MKLFGGKKGGAHSKDTVHTVASELETEAMEAEQQEMEDAVEAAVQPEIPMIVDDLMIEETSEQDAEQELSHADGGTGHLALDLLKLVADRGHQSLGTAQDRCKPCKEYADHIQCAEYGTETAHAVK